MRILQSKKTTNNKYLNLFDLDYIDRQGTLRSWQLVSRQEEPRCVSKKFETPDGVVIVPLHISKNRLVLIREYRVAVDGYQYAFPAGLVDPGEDLNQTITRELKEETGLNLLNILEISPPLYTSAGLTDESISMAFIECDGEPTNQYNESSEDIETIFVSQESAKGLCQGAEEKFDIKTWLVVTQFARTGQIV